MKKEFTENLCEIIFETLLYQINHPVNAGDVEKRKVIVFRNFWPKVFGNKFSEN